MSWRPCGAAWRLLMEPSEKGYSAWAARRRVPLGFAISVAYLALARPTVVFFAAGLVPVLAGLALRAWAAGCLVKGSRLSTGGPYGRTRNPLYLGSSLMAAGFALAGRSLAMAAAAALLLAFVYAPVIRREAEFLEDRFGEDYRRYAARVPLFLPRLRPAVAGQAFAWPRYRKNREYQAALGCALGVLFLIVRMLHWIPDFP
jgi:protein-S-isoprenylcysteine O-methyltransferase Ste14